MAISPKMLAVLRKVDAARTEHFAGLRARAERQAKQVRARKAAAKKTQATKKPTIKKSPLRAK